MSALLLVAAASCSSGGGIFQPPKASGVVVASLPGSSTPLSTSPSAPLIVNDAFSIALREDNYAASFSAAIASYTAPTTQSCYTVAMDATQKIAVFTPHAAPPIGGTSTSPSPCNQPGNDVESALFQDQQGNKTVLYFENQLGLNPSAIQARLLSNGQLLTTTSSSPVMVSGSFSVSLSEPGYTGPFTATIVSFTAPTTQSCYTVAMDSTGTVATFTPRNAPPIAGGSSSPCSQKGTDIEGILFQDIRGSSNQQFFENS
jgi:hypothetical protein